MAEYLPNSRDIARLGFVTRQIKEIEEARRQRLEEQPERDLINDRSGFTAIEYALIIALMAVAAIAAIA